MWDWERASVPYRPIYRRRLLRRRVLTLLIVAAIALPYYLYHQSRVAQPIGQRVFDQVVSTVALRYFDPSYHGVSWGSVADQYRPRVVNAPTIRARYAALRSMLAQLHDSHTAVYSPQDLQPPRDQRRHAVFGMSPDGFADAPAVDWKTLAPGVGYLRITSFPDSMNSVLRWAMSDLRRDRALVLDLRGNPGGLVDSVDEVAGMFLPAGTLISTGTRRYHFFGSQRFSATGDAGVTYGGRLVVLIDKNSRSGAESLARALQYYHRATLVGTHTAGKVLGVDVEIPLDDGGLLRVATLDMRDPSGQRLEGQGVAPDVFAEGERQLPAAVALENEPQSPLPATSLWVCPISIELFWLSGEDPKRGYARYGVSFKNDAGGSYEATLAVTGAQPGQPRSVLVQRVDAQTSAATFVWPTHDPVGVTISRIVDLRNGSVLPCTPAQKDSMNSEDRPEAKGVREFDDGPISFSSEVVAEPIAAPRPAQNADLLFRAAPKYPQLALQQGISGVVVVEVTIGPGGQVISAKVYRSSGNRLLDDAAVKAAQASTYSEPTENGKAVTRQYLINYTFQIQ